MKFWPMRALHSAILAATVAATAVSTGVEACLPRPVRWSGCPEWKRYEYESGHMGAQFHIVLYATDQRQADAAAKAAFARVAELDQILSDYKDDSEAMRLGRGSGGEPTPVSDDLFRVLEASLEIARLTDGAFEPTLGPVVQLWRRARRQKELPDPDRLTAARGLVGWRLVHLDSQRRRVQLTKPGMRLDFGGIGKGFAADEALNVLKNHGIRRALISAGGDIVVGAPPPGQAAWKIGVAPHEAPDRPPARFLHLAHAAVSTSGDAEQFVEIGGKRYSHIVDPFTGLGLQGRRSVTVVADRGVYSDSLATAFCVMDPAKAVRLADRLESAAALIIIGEGDTVRLWASSRWKDHER